MAELKYQIEGDPQKAIAALSKLVAKQEEAVQKLRDTNKAGRDVNRTFDGMGDAIGRYVTVGAGIAVVATALRQQEQIANEAAQRISGMADNLKRLIQISNSAGESRALQGLARGIASDVGIPEGQAIGLAVEGITSGFTPAETKTLSRAVLFEADAQRFIKAIDSIHDAFTDLPGGVEGTANVALRGLKERTQANVNEVLEAAKANADIFGELGGTFVQAAAIGTVTAGQRDPQQAAAQVRMFLSKLITDPQGRFKGGADVFADIKASEALSDPEMDKLFGEREKAGAALARGLLLRNLPRMETLAGAMSAAAGAAGTPSSLFAQAQRRAIEDPRLASDLAKRRAEERLAESREGEGITENRRKAVIAETMRRLEGEGRNFLNLGLNRLGLELSRVTGMSPEYIAQQGAVSIRGRAPFMPATRALRDRVNRERDEVLESSGSLPGLDTNNAVVAENNMLLKQQNDLLRGLQISGFLGATRPSLNAGIE